MHWTYNITKAMHFNQLFYVLAKLGILVIWWFIITYWLWPVTALYLTVDDVVGSDNSA
jgi:hypothetical protein